jgi:archaellum component FlaF (FlaF/FlaG flagellin family)
MTSGTYRIMPMYSEYGQNNWRPCAGADNNYIEVTINGNECTFTGYGTAAECDYVINDIAMTGYMHNGRPINFDVNMTNNGQSDNKLLYMFNNGAFIAAGYVDLGAGETGNVHYTYLFQNAGNYTLTWSWNEDGSDPIATRTITINPMPAANLSATCTVLNVPSGTYTINSDKFSVELTITNNGQTTYDEDISVKLYKSIYGNTGTMVQAFDQRVTLAPNASTNLVFHFDNVMDGWKYFCNAFYYSNGDQIDFAGVGTCTVVFPNTVVRGDVNKDGEVSIADVNAVIDFIQRGIQNPDGDVNGDGEVSIADINTVIDLILGS